MTAKTGKISTTDWSACPCRFRRKEKSGFEDGIAVTINGSVEAIIDVKGKRIPIPWDYLLHEYYGCFHWYTEKRKNSMKE